MSKGYQLFENALLLGITADKFSYCQEGISALVQKRLILGNSGRAVMVPPTAPRIEPSRNFRFRQGESDSFGGERKM